MRANLLRLVPIIIVAAGFFVAPSLVRQFLPIQLPSTMPALHANPRPLPAFEFRDGDGRKFTLADFRGRFVLLNFWATWCAPCKEEMPSLNALASHFPTKDLAVIPISVDLSGAISVRPYYKRFALDNLPVYADPTSDAMHALGVIGIPTTLLINSDGLEIGRLVGAAQWDAPAIIEGLSKVIAR
jgi:thiol-disulfide isomerase/thioredoxin